MTDDGDVEVDEGIGGRGIGAEVGDDLTDDVEERRREGGLTVVGRSDISSMLPAVIISMPSAIYYAALDVLNIYGVHSRESCATYIARCLKWAALKGFIYFVGLWTRSTFILCVAWLETLDVDVSTHRATRIDPGIRLSGFTKNPSKLLDIFDRAITQIS